MILVATKKVGQQIFFTLLFCSCFGIRDQRSGMDKNQDPGSGINIPDPQHCKIAFANSI
jgi:hypothetical protein